MKVVFAVHTYYPAHNGVQAVTQYIAEGIAKKHQVSVITEKKEGLLAQEICQGVKIYRIHVELRHSRFCGDKKAFFRIIEEERPDVLVCVCTQSWPYDWTCRKRKGIMCKKILYTHGYTAYMEHYPILYDIFHLKLRAFLYHWYWKNYYKNAYKYLSHYDKVIYLSQNNIATKYAAEHGLSNGIIMENAVEDEFFDGSILEDDAHFQADRAVHFIYVANYDSNKNQLELVDLFVRANIANSILTMIGSRDNEYYHQVCQSYLEKCAKNPELRINALLGLSRDRIREKLSEADVFVCVSRHEEYPVMLCEAAAKGLAIISTDVGHASEMPGCIVARTPEEFVQQMQRMQREVQLRRTFGTQLREYANEHCRIADKVKQFEELLHEVTQSEKEYAE